MTSATASPGLNEPISEEWVRKRLNIETNNLEDIKSLSLPGTYNEKITYLGDALFRFTRLKELDLSRNSICSLEGLENLKYLEKLNLYYNCVCSLKELERLSRNKNLIELDLRLNPIAKEEIDYRLYLIHILPSLKYLDDREIRDSEKQMAFTYFNNNNTNNNRNTAVASSGTETNAVNSRVKSVSNIIKRSAGIKDNDDNDAFQSYYTASSELKIDTKSIQPNFEQYSPRSLKRIGDEESQMYASAQQHQQQRKNSSSDNGLTSGSRRKSVSLQDVAGQNDNNLQFDDEYEAYSVFKSRGTFTPNPRNRNYESAKSEKNLNQNQRENVEVIDESVKEILNDKSNPIFSLLDLVDRYWNGTKSLHKHYKFLGQANQILTTDYRKYMNSNQNVQHENDVNALKSKIKHLHEENLKLNQKLIDNEDQLKDYVPNTNIKVYLNEIENLKKRLGSVQEENKLLKKENSQITEKAYSNYQLDAIESQNDLMKREVEIMRIKVKQYEQLQNLTEMLQESHKSLVTTNEHLLREINDQRFKQNLFLNESPQASQQASQQAIMHHQSRNRQQQHQQQQQNERYMFAITK